MVTSTGTDPISAIHFFALNWTILQSSVSQKNVELAAKDLVESFPHIGQLYDELYESGCISMSPFIGSSIILIHTFSHIASPFLLLEDF